VSTTNVRHERKKSLLFWCYKKVLYAGPKSARNILTNLSPKPDPTYNSAVEGTLPLGVAFENNFKRMIVNSEIWMSQVRRRLLGFISSVKARAALNTQVFLNIIHIRLNVFWSNGFAQTSSHSRIISNEQKYCSVTRADMNEPSMQRINWHYDCPVP